MMSVGGGRQLEHDLEKRISDTPTRMNRVRQHNVRVAVRGGTTDNDSVEAYAVLMDRIQYNKEYVKRLQEKEKKV
jgi:hypothetical protein